MINIFKKKTVQPSEFSLPEDQYMMYNGVRVHWFIGDCNRGGGYWECWGSCKDLQGHLRPYQMFAKIKATYKDNGALGFPNKKQLYDITVLYHPTNIYYHEETYKRLTA